MAAQANKVFSVTRIRHVECELPASAIGTVTDIVQIVANPIDDIPLSFELMALNGKLVFVLGSNH